MTHLQTRYAELQSAGRVPLYCYKHAPVELGKADNVQITLGLQPNGRYLNLADLDSHKPGQDATTARAAFAAALPHVARKIEWHDTPHGLHGFFETCKRLPTGRLYDSQGNHIGELLSEGSHTRDHGNIAPDTLTLTEIDHLFLHWSVDCGEPGSAQWKERAKEGAQLTTGYARVRVSRQELRAFLQTHCGNVGRTLDAYFDERGIFDRSAAAGNLMQTLMYHARKLPGGASFRSVMAYWMAADSYGKASDRDYNQEKDGCSLIAQIVHGDMKKNGKPWICPSWIPGNTATAAPAPLPAPEAPRPAHRPVGDRGKQIARLKRLLKHRWEDETTGKFYYFVDDLDDWADRCGVSRRSIQSYLTELEEGEQIERGQEGGRGGRPWMLIKQAFFGMQITPEIAPKIEQNRAESAPVWDADQIAEQSILTPQTAESTPVCKVDHQNTCVPTSAPQAAHSGESAALTFEERVKPLVERDMAILQALYQDLRPLTPEERAKNRKPKQKRFIPRKEQRLDKRYTRAHGEAPAPTPYRPRATPLPLESLPEPPAAAAPAGAQGGGAPLPGPQAGPALFERLRILKAERQAAHVE